MLAVAILLSTAGVIVANSIDSANDAKATTQVTNSLDPTTNITRKLDSKNETVYVIADADAKTKSIFIGNTIYDGDEELPFELKVSYYLDGAEISANDLAGKSGRVKMVYNYQAKATYQGKYVPFMAVTELQLDGTKFNNVRLTNGKIISEGDNYIIAGYGFPGVNEDLEIDSLPSSFTVEANVNNFGLGNTYTVLMNDMISDIDTSKLSDIDGIVSSMNQLADGFSQILNGSAKLTDGLGSALDGTKKLYVGSETLAGGIKSASEGADKLAGGLKTITSNNAALQQGATSVITNTLTNLNTSISANPELSGAIAALGIGFPITVDNYTVSIPKICEIAPQMTESLMNAKSLVDLSTGIIGYTRGVATVATGAEELASGLSTINSKTPELVNGLGSLVDGMSELYDGSKTLHTGLNTLKVSGIDKLVSFANNNLASFTRNARSTVAAAGSYHNFGGSDAKTVKFIVKTASIK